MKKSYPCCLFLVLTVFVGLSNDLKGNQWKPDDGAAVFTLSPNRVLTSPYFREVLKTYGLIGFAYSNIMGDHHVVALEKEMGVQIEETREVSLVVGNFLETIINFPVSTSGNYQALNNSSLTFILRTNGEVSPDEIFEKFDRWASGPAFNASDIERFRRNGGIEPEKIDEMSKARRINRDLYAGLEKSEKVGKTTLFAIPVGMLDQSLQKMESLKFSLGVQAEKGSTTFAFGSRAGVLAFFAHENKFLDSNENTGNVEFASFSVPLDEGLLRQIESGKLSDPNGPLGPLAITLGDAMYKIREVSGTSKLSGGRAHFDLVVRCADSESAQAIWSVGQASLGMAQITAMRQQMKNPKVQPAVPLEFLNKIKLKHQGNDVLIELSAAPAELFPWAANKKFP